MSDVSEATDTADSGPVVANIQKIRIIKVKGETVDVDFDALPIEVYKEMLRLGAETYINKVGMSKVGAGLTKLEGNDLDKAQKAVVAQAQKNVDDMMKGDIKLPGGKSDKKVPAAVNTEAMRLARNIVKDLIKKDGKKISHYPASEITAGAKVVLANDPSIYEQAEANLKARAETPTPKGIDIGKLLKVDPELVAKAEEAKAKKRKSPKGEGQLSAKQAGMVAPRQKPKPSQATAH